ncbi:MAG: sugar nucleotide-binding protein [Verrucomicrobiota bacterium]|nr:sugar nucleotide-binding protein [Verrucomicrobiota bacterium]
MIILLGSTGDVGRVFQKQLSEKSVEWEPLSGRQFTLANKAELVETLKAKKAFFLVSCAGYTGKPNVDACELDKGNCLDGNAILPSVIREVCEDVGIGWGHVSSGCIFAGERPGGGGWREDDAPNFCFRQPPCSFYSGTKALGEEVLGWREADRDENWPAWEHESEPQGYVWRLRIPFNENDGPRNYLSKLQRYENLLQARNSLSHLEDFVEACWSCVEKEVPYGIYNVTNPGSVTTSDVVELILKHGVNNKDYKFFDSEEEFMSKAAKAPRSNCVLDTAKLQSVGIHMRPVQEALDWSLKNWKRED